MNEYNCSLCPRQCGAVRTADRGEGFCRMGTEPVIARAALHLWEEPCISGERGSGAVFFSGCNLGCVFCQNREISFGCKGLRVTADRLREIYGELIAQGAHNINLVTPLHFAEAVLESLSPKPAVPVVVNCGGYECIDTVRLFRGVADIWLPDMKYSDSGLAARLSSAPDYPEIAKAAIKEMYAQTGPCEFDAEGMLVRGTVVRHLILPGELGNTFGVIDWVRDTFRPGELLFSLMSQYTPIQGMPGALGRRLSQEEYDEAELYLYESGIEDGFLQELSSAQEEYTPPFDLTGVKSDGSLPLWGRGTACGG